jgi:ribose-phosphate pyrophosphokinase
MDLHALQIEGFFNIPSVHLSAETAFAEVIQNEGWQSSVIIAPDVGSIRRAKNLAQHLNTSDGFVDKHRMSAKQVESHALIGHVRQQNVVLVDDLISTCQTVLTAAHICRAAGAKKIRVVATHALFVNSMFEEDVIEKIVVTDTVPLKTTSKRVKVVSVAPIFTKSIHDLLS